MSEADAPGAPGIPPTWASSAKDVVGCALGPARLWFTTGFGIVNEVYWPHVDMPQTRDLGFLVGDGRGFWVEVKRLGSAEVRLAAPGVPAVRVTHRHERFRLHLEIVPDHYRDVLLLRLRLDGDAGLRPYVLLAPHLGGTGLDNLAAAATFRGRRVLWAEHGPAALALLARTPGGDDALTRASAGYVGASDGWQDFARKGAMTWEHPAAGPGNVALMGELPRRAMLALGFAGSRAAAATLASSSLLESFAGLWREHVAAWQRWHGRCESRVGRGDLPAALRDQLALSTMVLRTHQDATFTGAMVASLSVPWGSTTDNRGGYHLVWPRDLVECAGALLALGAEEEGRDVLRYLMATQCEDGRWNQNQWLDGEPFWTGVQLDEVAFPVLLAAALAERDALGGIAPAVMVARALAFIARHGPASDQDRWEENAGVNPFTLAVCIAALIAGADFLAPREAALARTLADFWNASLERWTAVRGTALARRLGVAGYYVRIAPPRVLADAEALAGLVVVKNRACDREVPAEELVGADFLQLVRLGLRRADDPLVVDSLRVVDALLKVATPVGPVWRRYTGDGYGEHDDGSPFDGTGVGRGWPLLAGERGHYELAAGRDPLPFLETMAAMAGRGGLIPEQVWDGPPLPERGLLPGRPTGSAMPLAWAHAELVKLVRSRRLGRPFDRPEAVWRRYRGRRPTPGAAVWAPHAPIAELPEGARLLVALPGAGRVRWEAAGASGERAARGPRLGLWLVDIDTRDLPAGSAVTLAWRLDGDGDWRPAAPLVVAAAQPAQAGRRAATRER